MSKINEIQTVSDSFTIHRFDNGWMVEISGRDNDRDWATSKTVCNTEEQLFALIKQYNTMELDN